MGNRKAVIGGLLAAILCAGPAFPQDKGKEQEPIRIEYEGPWVLDKKNQRVYLSDNVRFQQGDFELRADRVIVWSRSGGDLQQPAGIYAEGNVRYRQGNQSVRAESLFHDFETGKAYITNLRARFPYPDLGEEVTVRAERLRGIAKGHLVAEEIRVSTCTFGIPHYDVYIDEAELKGRKERPPKGPYDIFPYDEFSLSGSGLVPRLEGIPFFWLPGYSIHYPGIQDFPIRSAKGGRSSRYGVYVYVDWGVDISKGFIDTLVPWDDSGEEDDDRTWGKVTLETDWREERGGAYGLDMEWEWGGYFGYVETYYLHDLGRNEESDFDLKFGELEHEDRGRARIFHRHDVTDVWRYELEASYLSDRDLLEEFFQEEFKEGKEQESVAYLRHRDGNLGAFVLERHRLNDFQTQLELLPRVEGHLVAEPVELLLPSLFTYSGRAQASHLRLRYDEETGLRPQDMWRFDFYNEIREPLDLWIAVLTPFGALRTTVFEDDLDGETQVRNIWSAGGRLNTVVFGDHDVEWDLVGLRKLRHILQADVRYAANARVNGGGENVFVFEEEDDLGRFEEGAIVLRNRFQTKTAGGDTVEFLTIAAAIEYWPNPIRDTRRPRYDNYQTPFHWIALAPGETGGFEDRHWSNLHWEVDFRPRNVLTARGRGEYNPEDQREEVREISAGLQIRPWISLSFGQTRVRDVSDLVRGGVHWRPGDKWSLEGYVSYDYEREDWVSRKVVVGRDFHDFILEANFERDEARDDTRFYVTIVPKFLGKRARRTGAFDRER